MLRREGVLRKAENRTDTCTYCHVEEGVKRRLSMLKEKLCRVQSVLCPVNSGDLGECDVAAVRESEKQLQERVTECERQACAIATHKLLKDVRRSLYKEHEEQGKSPDGKVATLVLDFKENMRTGRGKEQCSRAFFQHSQVAVLGIVMFCGGKRTSNLFYSDCLSKDSLFALDCLRQVLSGLGDSVETVNVWSDGGKSFKSGQFVHEVSSGRLTPDKCSVSVHFLQNTMGSPLSTVSLVLFQARTRGVCGVCLGTPQ
jgi:hypothetical protein